MENKYNCRIKVPAILGPTASGKTSLALFICNELKLEIISCDSRQIYKYLDIGTAKPTKEEQQKVKHWMIDIITPDKKYSAYEYSIQALNIIKTKNVQNNRVLICGGTGLYFNSLSKGIGPQVPPDEQIRKNLKEIVEKYGKERIYNMLAEIDTETASKSHPSNLHRNIRALEVYYKTGIPLSQQKRMASSPKEIDFFVIKLFPPRDILYDRINKRVDKMIRYGLFEEFLNIRKLGYNKDSPGLLSVGYKELFNVENGKLSLKEATEKIKQNTRNLAKRQITWFKHQVKGIEINYIDNAEKKILDLLKEYLKI